MGDLLMLERPVYGLGQAADLLQLRTDRVRAWLDGYCRSGTVYPPVIRPASTGLEVVTWGEFIELGHLREYRNAGVSLQAMRPVIAALREEYGTLYPLASADLYVAGREVVYRLQEQFEIPTDLYMVIRTGEVGFDFSTSTSSFLRKVEFNGPAASGWRPAGGDSPVLIDPEVSFGMPAVRGASTERLFELWGAEGADDSAAEWLAEVYELPTAHIRAAVEFEAGRGAAA